MSAPLQLFAALAIVALAAAWLLRRALSPRPHGGGCGGCPTDEFKAKLRR